MLHAPWRQRHTYYYSVSTVHACTCTLARVSSPRAFAPTRSCLCSGQMESHHKRVYGALVDAYDAAKGVVGLPEAASLTIR